MKYSIIILLNIFISNVFFSNAVAARPEKISRRSKVCMKAHRPDIGFTDFSANGTTINNLTLNLEIPQNDQNKNIRNYTLEEKHKRLVWFLQTLSLEALQNFVKTTTEDRLKAYNTADLKIQLVLATEEQKKDELREKINKHEKDLESWLNFCIPFLEELVKNEIHRRKSLKKSQS